MSDWVDTISVLKKIECPPFTLEWRSHANEFNRIPFWVFFSVPARDEPDTMTEVGRHGDLPPAAPEEMILWTVRMMLHKLVTHEVDEFFTFDGELIFDPHDHDR